MKDVDQMSAQEAWQAFKVRPTAMLEARLNKLYKASGLVIEDGNVVKSSVREISIRDLLALGEWWEFQNKKQ